MKKNNKFNPYKEMDLPQKEIEETLPFEDFAPDDDDDEQEEPRKQEIRDYLDNYQDNLNQLPRQQSQPLMFNDEGKENLIKDLLKVDWERIEHIIRGHKPKKDENTGDEYFVKIDGHYLNDYGVNSILHFLSFYLSKDIKLGRYSAEDVNIILKNFKDQFTDWFYDNIEEFGLDTPKKKKMSKMFVQSVLDLVDASYSCAIEGRTIELMLKQFSVMQQEPINQGGYNPESNQNQYKKPSVIQRIFE